MDTLTRWRINGEIIASSISKEEMGQRVAKASGSIKTMSGIANNAAWQVVLHAYSCISGHALDPADPKGVRLLPPHPNFRHRVKQGFKQALDEFMAYERALIYSENNRLFCLADLTPEFRKRYGNISDREYYDYWCSTGAAAYVKTNGWINNLWNKYRLSLIHHHVPHAEMTAWAMTACASLRLAECIYLNNIEVCAKDLDIPRPLLVEIFGRLNVGRIADKWDAALKMLEPLTESYDLDETESKNIQFGLDQLSEQWTSMRTMTDALSDSTESYSEVFRTKGEQKKALRMIAEMRE